MKPHLLFAFLLGTQWAAASAIDFNTSPLAALSGKPTLVFTLLNGDSLSNNTVSISGVNLGGGAPVGAPQLTTGAGGTLLGGLTMVDSIFQVEFSQAWTPGSALHFLLSYSTNFPAGSPDSFSVSILDPGTALPIPTLDPFGTDTFLSVDLRGGANINAYRSDLSRTSIDMQAPTITQEVITPEPGICAALGLGLCTFALIWRRRASKND